MSKSDHLLPALLLLRARGRMTAGQLAAELEVRVRLPYWGWPEHEGSVTS